MEERIDHMKYLPDMEQIDSDIPDRVIAEMNGYDPSIYTENDVRRALEHDEKTVDDFKALLSPAALPLLEEIAEAARAETKKHFGNSVNMFTPLTFQIIVRITVFTAVLTVTIKFTVQS